MPPAPPKKPTDSLTQVRDVDAPTLRGKSAWSEPAPSDPRAVNDDADADDALGDDGFEGRYEIKARLGEGGMGVIALAFDRRIGREIAMKVARSGRGSASDAKQRFLREARVQGQLEHPAVVPVYDLARDPSGTEYFTMKRVRGMTLEEVLFRLRSGSPSAQKQYSRRKLLTAFGSVCLAVHFAHTRGVLHRDLKPANVMLGDYGEVYILDWGIAKLRGRSADATFHPGDVAHEEEAARASSTLHGELMGTPGYMPPEQALGDFDQMDARSDVYSLGAILFEILTLEPLHPIEDVDLALASTKKGAETSFEKRFPGRDLPYELEEVCAKATALDPANRFESARELSDAVWRYLDGDRGSETRKTLASQHAQAAEALAERALAGGATSMVDRQMAMAEVSRALALDPDHPDALRVVIRLLTEPPREIPAEAQRDIDASANRTLRVSTRAATLAYLSWALYVPLLVWMGIRDWIAAGAVGIFWSITLLLGFASARRGSSAAWRYAVVVASTFAIGATTTLFGPFMLLPSMAAINATMLVVNMDRSLRVATASLASLAVIVPAALSVAGLLPSPYAFKDGALVILPQMVSFPEAATTVFLLLSNVAIIVTSCLMIARVRDSLTQAERRLHVQAWQLRQLVPREAQVAAATQPSTIGRILVAR